jgi:hypothetical protein
MKALRIGIGVAAVAAIVLKLFTYEFALSDDPSVGVAWRLTPSLVSRQLLPPSPAARSRVLVEDENDFAGRGLYRSTVSWGWAVLLVGWAAAALVSRKRASPRSRHGPPDPA